eukprot:TRINITY_DN58655_c0_g1_i1.p1 TRINITY_DN58655_c0_g1~~TRINITY_DN58655_c0_g1_i1.p1  ORF type:complete len:213 (-),score=18.21 TRINITY_DN58655_c0_g1_i1:3-641(-)
MPASAAAWKPDAARRFCFHCKRAFGLVVRRHHCRCCGDIYCGHCWGTEVALPFGTAEAQPVCRPCSDIVTRFANLRVGTQVLFKRERPTGRHSVLRRPLRETFAQDNTLMPDEHPGVEHAVLKLKNWQPLSLGSLLCIGESEHSLREVGQITHSSQAGLVVQIASDFLCCEAVAQIDHHRYCSQPDSTAVLFAALETVLEYARSHGEDETEL